MYTRIGTRIAAAAWIGCLLGAFPLPAQTAEAAGKARLSGAALAQKAAKAAGKPAPLKTHVCDHVTAISCGQTVSGTLSAADCRLDDGTYYDLWEFQGISGQNVTVTMTSSQVDAYVILADPGLTTAQQDDDGAGGTNARLTYRLTESGAWTIAANTAFADELGNYTLSLACAGGAPPAAPSNLQARLTGPREVELTWTDNSNNETEFRVEGRGPAGNFLNLGSVGPNATGAVVDNLAPGTNYTFRVAAVNAAGSSAYSNQATATTPGGDGFLTSPDFPDFRFQVRIYQNATEFLSGAKETDCLPETLCVSGAVPGRSEVFLRIIGPRPNGYLWPTIVRFTPSRVEVDVQQISTTLTKTYVLEAVPPDSQELSGLQDRTGFLP